MAATEAHEPATRTADLERQVIGHIRRLLEDERLRIDTRQGSRPLVTYRLHVEEHDDSAEWRGAVAEAGGDAPAASPRSPGLDVALLRRKWVVFAEVAGRLYVKVMSPLRAIARGEPGRPVTAAEVRRVADEASAGLRGTPSTVVVASTSGLTPEARELAERRAGRTLILLEPNGVGGWRVYGPNETRALAELFDPEPEASKRVRVRAYARARAGELTTGGALSADRVVGATMLPLQLVEDELRAVVQEEAGWGSRRLDGRLVLFRPGATTAQDGGEAAGGEVQGEEPLAARVRSLLARKGETEKKIAYLSERRAALGQHRDRVYEDLAALEVQETRLRDDFHGAPGAMARRRVTAQVLRTREESGRRRDLLGTLNDQIAVIGTHLQQLERARTGTSTGLAPAETIVSDALAAERSLAEAQALFDMPSGSEPLTPEPSEAEAAVIAELESEPGITPAKLSPADDVPTRVSTRPAMGSSPLRLVGMPRRPRNGRTDPE